MNTYQILRVTREKFEENLPNNVVLVFTEVDFVPIIGTVEADSPEEALRLAGENRPHFRPYLAVQEQAIYAKSHNQPRRTFPRSDSTGAERGKRPNR